MNRKRRCPSPRPTGSWFVAAILLTALGPTTGATAAAAEKSLVCGQIEQRAEETKSQMNPRRRTFLMFDAAERGCVDLIRRLLAEGAPVDARDRFGNTALVIAARAGEDDAVKLLLAAGSDVNFQNLAGDTPMLGAVTADRWRTAKLLLDAGADPDLVNRRGVSPLMAAAFNGNTRIAKMLLAAGASPSPIDATGKGPMVYAAAKGYAGIVRMLLAAGVAVDARYDNDLTALMWAAGHTNDVPIKEGLETVQILLDAGADPGFVDNRGRTALMIAAERGHRAIVERLLAAGADPHAVDAEGHTASDLASEEQLRAVLAAVTPVKRAREPQPQSPAR